MNAVIEHQKEFQELKKLQEVDSRFVKDTLCENLLEKDDKELMMPPAVDVNVRVAQMYRLLSFYGDDRPIWEEFKNCFIPNAILINNSNGYPVRLSVEMFERLFRSQVRQGEVPQFYVKELNYHTEQFGNVAQRFSAFEICYYDAQTPNTKGIASIQLLRIDGDWKISSMNWQEEDQKHSLPLRYRE